MTPIGRSWHPVLTVVDTMRPLTIWENRRRRSALLPEVALPTETAWAAR